ncbi:hypothetical protein ACWGDQ_26495, partial [Streptomyces sp. NPDC055005]
MACSWREYEALNSPVGTDVDGEEDSPYRLVTLPRGRPYPGMNEVTMCELLNRIWSRPRGEWTRVLRKELPALAAGIVEELRSDIPGFSTLIEDIDDEVVREHVESALLTVLGYREPSVTPQDEAADQIQPARQAEPARNPRQQDADTLFPQDVHGGGSLPTLKAVPSQGFSTGPERARRELFAVLTSDMPMSEIALAELAGA